MMSLGAYRVPAVRPRRSLDLRATVTPGGFMSICMAVGLVLALMPFWCTPTQVDASCSAATQRCLLDVQRVFGLREARYDIDLRGVGDVRYPTVHKQDFLEVTTHGNIALIPAELGNARYLVIDTMRKFRALSDEKRVDTRGTYGLDALPIIELVGGLAIWSLIALTFVAPVRIRAESDDDHLTIEASRWPRWPQTFAFDAQEIVGASPVHRMARGANGASNNVATIVLEARGARGRSADLFPRSLPDSPQVDELARALDRFVRAG